MITRIGTARALLTTKRRNISLRRFSAPAGKQMRVAIVGGGAAGLSTALHLAPLVEQGLLASPIDVYEEGPGENATSKHSSYGSGAIGRDIGVGIWSTALQPLRSERPSHKLAWEELTQAGCWVKNVGYRTPNGNWLAKSTLPATGGINNEDMPDLLFLREKDMLLALKQAVHLEEQAGTIKMQWTKSDPTTRVSGIHYETLPWSAHLALGVNGRSCRDYHLIVAADGMNSTLRKIYGGHRILQPLIGTAALTTQHPVIKKVTEKTYETRGQIEANSIEDRQYTVYRGNAALNNEEAGMDGVSFQTWGTGKSMRFATVPLSYPNGDGGRIEKQVWFITSSDERIASETDPNLRKEMLMASFSDWHDPIIPLLVATPAEEIFAERALAHKHAMGPVLDVNKILQHIQQISESPGGPGPAMIFIGDSYMTVDPILAQGFTMAIEGGYDLARALEQCRNIDSTEETSLAFDPYVLRTQLEQRHDRREERLIHLLRATELVQSMGQPDSGTLGGLFSRSIVRPLMQHSPGFMKRPIFDFMLKYSLGLPSQKK